jgi:hypothetical protein
VPLARPDHDERREEQDDPTKMDAHDASPQLTYS